MHTFLRQPIFQRMGRFICLFKLLDYEDESFFEKLASVSISSRGNRTGIRVFSFSPMITVFSNTRKKMVFFKFSCLFRDGSNHNKLHATNNSSKQQQQKETKECTSFVSKEELLGTGEIGWSA